MSILQYWLQVQALAEHCETRLAAVFSSFLAQVSFEHAANWGITEQERAPMLS